VITYIVMLLPRQFPASERVAAGVSYREMLPKPAPSARWSWRHD
jgi:hypothetical protein